MKPFYWFIRTTAWLVLRIVYRVESRILYPPPKGGAVLAANHTSHLDPPLISGFWPIEVHFMASDYLFKPFLFGSLIRAVNAHPVRRGVVDLNAFRMIESLLREGKHVVIFPEGTRSRGNELAPFKGGVAKLIARSETCAVPIYIDGAYEIWGALRRFPKLWGKIRITYGKALEWKDFKDLPNPEEAFSDALRVAIEELRPR